jgi:hypothetical protein
MPGAEGVRALVSVHDVMPETLVRVQHLLDLCAVINPGPVTLLVVPGRAWDASGIKRLHAWQAQGHRLAGHGWVHRVERFGGLGHRLHGLLISRRVAEHLALDADGIARLIRRCHSWFADQGLGPPDLYVPPAWALGSIPPRNLARLPFTRYEVLSGVRDAATTRLRPLPLLGYEADTPASPLPTPARGGIGWARQRPLASRCTMSDTGPSPPTPPRPTSTGSCPGSVSPAGSWPWPRTQTSPSWSGSSSPGSWA